MEVEDLTNSFNEDDEKELITQFKTTDDVESPHREHLDVLLKIFGHREFRPMQWKIINSIINDRRDNCAIMATGYGKSLCYQYPSVYCGGITIVISPLISLMEDQLLSLTISNIPACLLGTAQTQKNKVVQDIFDNKYSIIYVTPEFCCGDYGKQLLVDMNDKLNVILLAIDEAHCISSWGHDFRLQYRQLSTIRSIMPHVPILAVTATATPQVRNDIVKSLRLSNPQIIYSGFDRPNLYFSVRLKENYGIIGDLRYGMIKQDGNWIFSGPTIIYCITRKQTEHVAELIRSQGINCLTYHAGLSVKQRKETHEKFVRDKVSVIVATIAFGMGIDKPDVRNVIHYGSSKDIESYYQEVGRAGRDGQPANCTMFYSSADFEILRSLREFVSGTESNRKQKEAMTVLFQKYLETSGCRRQFILQHFGDVSGQRSGATVNCCDNCTKKLKQKTPEKYEELNSNGLMDITDYAHTFLTSIKILGSNRGLQTYIKFIRGSNSMKMPDKYRVHPLHGSGKHKNDEWWKCIGRLLERDKYFDKQTVSKPGYSYCTVHMNEKGQGFLANIEKQDKQVQILIEPPPDLRVLLKKKVIKEFDSHCQSSTYPTVSIKVNSTNLSSFSLEKKVLQVKKEESIVEDESQKEERMKIYRKLLAKRTELAFALDCMPYMIASNEVLMNMAQLKPRNVETLRQLKLDGFTEAKINKFGEEFISIIRLLCPLTDLKSIKDILTEHPIDEIKFSPTIEVTFDMFKSGMSVETIATARKMVNSTITSHLLKCMKLGHPIKLKDLNVPNHVKDVVTKVVKNIPPGEDNKILTIIKNRCPSEISFDQIKVVMTYLDIRNHIEKYYSEYEEYDKGDVDDNRDMKTQQMCDTPTDAINIELRHNSSSTKIDNELELIEDNEDVALNALVDEIESGGYLNNVERSCSDSIEPVSNNNAQPPPKKQKLSMALLDSPPRQTTKSF